MTEQNQPVEITMEEAVKLADFDSISAFVGALQNPAEAVYTAILLAQEHPEEAKFILRTMREEFLATIANNPDEVKATDDGAREFVERWVDYHNEVHAAPLAGAKRRKLAVDNANKRTEFLKALRNAKTPEEAIEAAKAAGIPVEFVNGDPNGDHSGHDHAMGFKNGPFAGGDPSKDMLN